MPSGDTAREEPAAANFEQSVLDALNTLRREVERGRDSTDELRGNLSQLSNNFGQFARQVDKRFRRLESSSRPVSQEMRREDEALPARDTTPQVPEEPRNRSQTENIGAQARQRQTPRAEAFPGNADLTGQDQAFNQPFDYGGSAFFAHSVCDPQTPRFSEQLRRASVPRGNDSNLPIFGGFNRLKAKSLGTLETDNPQRYLQQLEVLKSQHSDETILQALCENLNGNPDTVVRDWYYSIITSQSPREVNLRSHLGGWMSMIHASFQKTLIQNEMLLDKISFTWTESIMSFVSRLRSALSACGRVSPATQRYEIEKRLPLEFRFTPFAANDLEGFIAELRYREAAAKNTHQSTLRLYSSSEKLSGNRFARQKENYPKISDKTTTDKTITRKPAKPCPRCKTSHFYSESQCPDGKWFKRENLKTITNFVYEDSEDNEWDEDVEDPIDVLAVGDSPFPSRPTSKRSSSPASEERNSKRVLGDLDAININLVEARSDGVFVHQTSVDGTARCIKARPVGGPPSEYSYTKVGHYRIQVANSPGGTPAWLVLDSGSPISLVAAGYLEKVFPSAVPMEKEQHKNLFGIAGDKLQSTHGTQLSLFCPLKDGACVEIQGYFHIVPELSAGLLIGNDIATAYLMKTDSEDSTVQIGPNGLIAELSFKPMANTTYEVSSTEDRIVRPGQEVRIATDIGSSSNAHRGEEQVFIGQSVINSESSSKGMAVDALLAPWQSKICFANAGKTPLRIRRGQRVGWSEPLATYYVFQDFGQRMVTGNTTR
ncbi:hypothetical protein PYCC9005_000936 [Savitreella phatthalungensis]